MALVAGAYFGTLSIRVTLLDAARGCLGTAAADYHLHRRRYDPNYSTQSHVDQMDALCRATRSVFSETSLGGEEIVALAIDATGSSVFVADANLQPLDEDYM